MDEAIAALKPLVEKPFEERALESFVLAHDQAVSRARDLRVGALDVRGLDFDNLNVIASNSELLQVVLGLKPAAIIDQAM